MPKFGIKSLVIFVSDGYYCWAVHSCVRIISLFANLDNSTAVLSWRLVAQGSGPVARGLHVVARARVRARIVPQLTKPGTHRRRLYSTFYHLRTSLTAGGIYARLGAKGGAK